MSERAIYLKQLLDAATALAAHVKIEQECPGTDHDNHIGHYANRIPVVYRKWKAA